MLLIIGSIYVCSTSSVGSSSAYAIFVIGSPLFRSFTVTWNSTVFACPSGTSTSIPWLKLSCVSSAFDSPPTFMLPGTNVVPSGIVSFTVVVVGAVPSFLTVIVYVIGLSFVTLVPSSGSAVLLGTMCGLCTSILTSFVGSSSTTAPFTISYLYIPCGNSFTVT